jgi:hypothetical protein
MQAKSYKSALDFRRALEHRLQNEAEKKKQNLQRLRRKVAFNRFLARIFAGPESPWILKGGYAMELRLAHARATRDIDLALRGKPQGEGAKQAEHIQNLLFNASAKDLGDFFVFRVGGVQMELDGPLYGGARYSVEAMIDNRLFVSFHVDVAVGDYIPAELETAQEQDFISFAGIKPFAFPMIPREVQFAEKIHAYTMPRSVPNSRARDLVDMILLIQDEKMSQTKVKEALQAVFNRRKSHALPDKLEPAPERWAQTFAVMAEECGLKISLAAAFELVSRFYNGLTGKEKK